MKKQKFELAHDIIAEKIWNRLPEQDVELRIAKKSFKQRYSDYKGGKGSLLGEKELIAWADMLERFDLDIDSRSYVVLSQFHNRRRKKRNFIGFISIIIVAILAIVLAFYLKRENNKFRVAEYMRIISLADRIKEKGHYEEALITLEGAYEVSKKSPIGEIENRKNTWEQLLILTHHADSLSRKWKSQNRQVRNGQIKIESDLQFYLSNDSLLILALNSYFEACTISQNDQLLESKRDAIQKNINEQFELHKKNALNHYRLFGCYESTWDYMQIALNLNQKDSTLISIKNDCVNK